MLDMREVGDRLAEELGADGQPVTVTPDRSGIRVSVEGDDRRLIVRPPTIGATATSVIVVDRHGNTLLVALLSGSLNERGVAAMAAAAL